MYDWHPMRKIPPRSILGRSLWSVTSTDRVSKCTLAYGQSQSRYAIALGILTGVRIKRCSGVSVGVGAGVGVGATAGVGVTTGVDA